MTHWVTLMVLALFTSGCGLSAQNVPLPGKRVSGDTYRLSATFSDALNLTEGAPVKLHGATVGEVDSVRVQDYRARVQMKVVTSARLHGGASARLRGTTPLGELYVDLMDGSAGATLPDGSTLSEGTVAPTIEDTMATTSVFLNGGGITELGTILRESNLALGGREESARDLLTRLDSTTAELQASTDDLEKMLVALAGLSTSLEDRRATIRAALDDVGPTAKAMQSQVEDLTRLLKHIEKFGGTTSSVIDETHDDLVSALTQMGPIFDQMNALEGDLTPAIEKLVTFSKLLDEAVPTQFLNTDLHIHLDQLPTLPGLPLAAGAAPLSSAQPSGESPSTSGAAPPAVVLPDLPDAGPVQAKPLVDTLLGLLGMGKKP